MANKILQPLETAITWLSSGGSAALTMTSLANNAGRQGAHYDLGTASATRRFRWRAWCKPAATPTVGNLIRVYLKTSDGTSPDNDDGTGDIAVSAEDKLRNLLYLDAIVVDEAASVVMAKSGTILVPDRYVAPVFWNASAASFTATATDHGFSLTPVPDEVQ